MRDRYRLGRLRDDELLAAVARLVAQEREQTAELLAHLGELDERGTCIERGFSSLFAYCTRQLGFCNSSAWLRVCSSRVCRKFPIALELVASGALNVSVLTALSSRLNQDNAAELFEACSFKSTRHIEELLAARFPKPDRRDSMRRLPTRAETIAPCAGSSGDPRASAEDAGVAGSAARVFAPEVAAPEPGSLNVTLDPLGVALAHVNVSCPGERRGELHRADEGDRWAHRRQTIRRHGFPLATSGPRASWSLSLQAASGFGSRRTQNSET